MNTISFSNAFKSLMATLGAKTTDSNYAVPLVNKTSGAPQGFMDMSSLASVLGGIIKPLKTFVKQLKDDDSLDERPIGLYTINPSSGVPQGLPSGLTSPTAIFVGIGPYDYSTNKATSTAWSVQLLFASSGRFFFRIAFSASLGAWTELATK